MRKKASGLSSSVETRSSGDGERANDVVRSHRPLGRTAGQGVRDPGRRCRLVALGRADDREVVVGARRVAGARRCRGDPRAGPREGGQPGGDRRVRPADAPGLHDLVRPAGARLPRRRATHRGRCRDAHRLDRPVPAEGAWHGRPAAAVPALDDRELRPSPRASSGPGAISGVSSPSRPLEIALRSTVRRIGRTLCSADLLQVGHFTESGGAAMNPAGRIRRIGQALADWTLFRVAGRAGMWLAILLAIAVLAAPARWGLLSVGSLVLLVAFIVLLPRAAVRRLTSSEAALGRLHEEHRRQSEAVQHERREMSVWVADQVARDRLTGLLNRTAFLEGVTAVLGEADSSATRAVVVVDLVRFSAFNEAHGPAVGDEMLVAVAARLSSVLRPEDIVARLDGDVFGALLPNLPRELVQQVVERVQRAVGSTYSIGGGHYDVGAVCGVVSIDPTEPVSAPDVLRRAEIALQNAKTTARPVVVFEPRLEDQTRDRLR